MALTLGKNDTKNNKNKNKYKRYILLFQLTSSSVKGKFQVAA